MTVITTAAACLIDAAPASFRPETATQGTLTIVAQDNPAQSTDSDDEDTEDEDAYDKTDRSWDAPMPPSLEDYIPPGSLPEVIAVREWTTAEFSIFPPMSSFLDGPWETIIDRNAITFVRKSSAACLDLRNPSHAGSGNHSVVWLAPLTLPPAATSAPSDTPRAVAVKLATWEPCDREMLAHEARIYSAFPRALQDASDAAVPKFYGYYEPVFDAARANMRGFHRPERAGAAKSIQWLLTKISPILLEHCGKPVSARRCSTADKSSPAPFQNLSRPSGLLLPAQRARAARSARRAARGALVRTAVVPDHRLWSRDL